MTSESLYPHKHTARLRGVPAPDRHAISVDALTRAEANLGPLGDAWIAEIGPDAIVFRFRSLEDLKRLDRALLAQGVTQGGIDVYDVFERYEHQYELDLTRHRAVLAPQVRLRLVSITRELLGPTGARRDIVANTRA
jgi:hypothetical protein